MKPLAQKREANPRKVSPETTDDLHEDNTDELLDVLASDDLDVRVGDNLCDFPGDGSLGRLPSST